MSASRPPSVETRFIESARRMNSAPFKKAALIAGDRVLETMSLSTSRGNAAPNTRVPSGRVEPSRPA
jgi:hypothetical protein